MSINILGIISVIFILNISQTFHNEGSEMKQYLPNFKIEFNNDSVVDTQPKIFASGITHEEYIARDFILPNENEIYFCLVKRDYSYASIYHTTFVDGKWAEPKVAQFATDTTHRYFEPFISYDGKKFFFVSDMVEGREKSEYDFDVWVMDKSDEGWSEPKNLGAPINTKCLEAFPSVTYDGTLYFVRNDEGMTRSDVYRSRFINGKYSEPEKLPVVINGEGDDNAFNTCIAPDESNLIFCSYRQDGNLGMSDYYISFRDENDNWSEAINLGEKFNSPGYEVSLHFSGDSKMLIYSRYDVIKYISAEVINEIRK